MCVCVCVCVCVMCVWMEGSDNGCLSGQQTVAACVSECARLSSGAECTFGCLFGPFTIY